MKEEGKVEQPKPLTYEQEIHAVLHSSASNTKDLLLYLRAQFKQEKGEPKKLTGKVIAHIEENLRRIQRLIPQALERREASHAPTPAPPPIVEAAQKMREVYGKLCLLTVSEATKKTLEGITGARVNLVDADTHAAVTTAWLRLEEALEAPAPPPAESEPIEKLRELIIDHEAEEDAEGNIVVRFNCAEWMEIAKALPTPPTSKEKK